jgi:glycosyltransferase involved in cell wall biosynthesis
MSNTFCLGAALMIKNESKRICVSLESIKEHVDCIVILDTGSTDDTIQIVKDWCNKNKLLLYLYECAFVDFSTTRNVLLKHSTNHCDWALLLDSNDELRTPNNKPLRSFIDPAQPGYFLQQMWDNHGRIDTYFNIRLIKISGGTTWEYKTPIHEYIVCTSNENAIIKLDDIIIFQDRKFDEEKSRSRYTRDREIFEKEYKSNNRTGRTLYYYAQTEACLQNKQNAYMLYMERTKYFPDDFKEEIFWGYVRAGDVSKELEHTFEHTCSLYLSAFVYSSKIFDHPRVEPLVELGQMYINQKNWKKAYDFLHKACELPYPNEKVVLFVNKIYYDYTRYHLMGIVAYYVNKLDEGKNVLDKILHLNHSVDLENYKWYKQTNHSIKIKNKKYLLHL